MCWFRTSLLLVLSSPVWAIEGYIIGGGVETDNADGLSGVVVVDLGVTKKTWLSASFGKNTVDLPSGANFDTQSGDIGVDYFFDPIGVRVETAFWGDDLILDSKDWRASLYWRNEVASISAKYEKRDFDFNIPRTDLFAGRRAEFDATGIGASARFNLGERISLNLSAMEYDYSVRLNQESNAGILTLLSASRLSLINNLIDRRAGIGLDLDVGDRTWGLDYGSWKGAVDGSTTNSTTLRFLTPMSSGSDVEFSIGVDDSDRYESVTFISVFLFFYGG